jgi:WD40 repeat protein
MVTTTTSVRSDHRCPMCGRNLAPGAPDGLCPRCLLRAGIEEPDPTPGEPSAQPQDPLNMRFFGDYELLGEIGRGGMGVVYQARQLGTQRTVALKFLSGGALASRDAVHRFHTEARAAALLEHPGIVPIYEAGMHEGQYFLAMRFVGGGSLAQLAKRGPLPPRRVAEIIMAIAAAVQFAHARGVLHRDLKPGNILLDDAGAPLVSDFGLARLLESDDQLTFSSTLLGTVAYIAPEQAMGGAGAITTAADIYGLGAILYELLAGRPPFQRATMAETLRALHEEEPVPPSKVASGKEPIPPDLETICLKCLEKQPSRRYAAAQEVADDLSRFLADEPVHARAIGVPEKLWRWCRRKPALASLAASVLVLILFLAVGAPISILRINRARAEAEFKSYASDMRLASEALRNGDWGGVQELLEHHRPRPRGPDLRGFEWRYLANAVNQSRILAHQFRGLPMSTNHASPKLAAAGDILYNFRSHPGEALAWDLKTWAALPLKVPSPPPAQWWWCADRQILLAFDKKECAIGIYRLPGFERTLAIPVPGQATHAAISTDSRTLAVAFREGVTNRTNRILVWDLTTNSQRWVLGEYRREINGLGFSANGTVLAFVCEDGEIGLWSLAGGEALPAPVQAASYVSRAYPAAQFIGSSSTQLLLDRDPEQKTLEAWDWTTKELRIVYQTRHYQLESYAFSPDRKLLGIAQSDGAIALLEMPAQRQIGTLPGNGALPVGLAFSPSGKLLSAAYQDKSVKLWDVQSLRELETIGGNDPEVVEVAFTPDERSVLALLGDGAIRVWDLKAVLGRSVLWRIGSGIEWFSVSPDERVVATVDSFGWIHFRDRSSGNEIRKIQSGESGASASSVNIAFSPTGHLAAWASHNWFGTVDYDSGFTTRLSISGRFGFCNPLFLPPGSGVIVAGPTNLMRWDISAQEARPFATLQKSVLSLAISPDASLLAGAQDGGAITLWDLASGRQITSVPVAHRPLAFEDRFSPDGRLLASAGADSTAKIWELHNGELHLLHTLRGHVGWMREAFFSPDGSRLVTCSSDDALNIWDIKTGLEVGTIYDHGNRFAWGTCFSKDGNTLYSANKQGDVRAWQAPPLHSP